MVLAVAVNLDVAHEHQLVVAFDLGERAREMLLRVFVVAAEVFADCAEHPLWRVNQPFTTGVVAKVAQQLPDAFAGLFFAHRFSHAVSQPCAGLGPRQVACALSSHALRGIRPRGVPVKRVVPPGRRIEQLRDCRAWSPSLRTRRPCCACASGSGSATWRSLSTGKPSSGFRRRAGFASVGAPSDVRVAASFSAYTSPRAAAPPARRPEYTQSAIDKPLTYCREQTPTARCTTRGVEAGNHATAFPHHLARSLVDDQPAQCQRWAGEPLTLDARVDDEVRPLAHRVHLFWVLAEAVLNLAIRSVVVLLERPSKRVHRHLGHLRERFNRLRLFAVEPKVEEHRGGILKKQEDEAETSRRA